jgi:hypothetical protein
MPGKSVSRAASRLLVPFLLGFGERRILIAENPVDPKCAPHQGKGQPKKDEGHIREFPNIDLRSPEKIGTFVSPEPCSDARDDP